MSSNNGSQPPDEASLYEAALGYLARYAATEAGLRRVLLRQVDRWARNQADREATKPVLESARAAIEGVIGRLVKAGAVSDAAFAESRAKSLLRGGQSNRAVQARLISKGVAPDVARIASANDADTELAAALVLLRKRRIGPYYAAEGGGGGPNEAAPVNDARPIKELGLLARAGFTRDIADRALKMSREEAESRIFDLRR